MERTEAILHGMQADLSRQARPRGIEPGTANDDFGAAVRIAQREYDREKPDVVVGSSRGGAVAMNIDCGDTPLILLCPAWKQWGTVTKVKSNTEVDTG